MLLLRTSASTEFVFAALCLCSTSASSERQAQWSGMNHGRDSSTTASSLWECQFWRRCLHQRRLLCSTAMRARPEIQSRRITCLPLARCCQSASRWTTAYPGIGSFKHANAERKARQGRLLHPTTATVGEAKNAFTASGNISCLQTPLGFMHSLRA